MPIFQLPPHMARKPRRSRGQRQMYFAEYVSTHNHEFYASGEWLKIRKLVLERDNYQCVSKNHDPKKSKTENLKVDHIRPLNSHQNLRLDPSNLQTLCGSCHTRKTNEDRKERERRDFWLERARQDAERDAKRKAEEQSTAKGVSGDNSGELTKK